MLFNANIILEILRSKFSKEIKSYMEQCIMNFDEYDLINMFDTPIDIAALGNIGEMTIENYCSEEENITQHVKGIFKIKVLIGGFEKQNAELLLQEIVDAFLIIAFSFRAKNERYSNLKLDYKYCESLMNQIL